MQGTLLIPTLNEAGSIGHVLRSFRSEVEAANRTLFKEAPIDWEVVVIDGASRDGTARVAETEGARVLTETRRGYGRAYRTGFEAARGEVLATMDGDGTYPVAQVPVLVRRLLDERLDFISGDRLSELSERRAMTTEHRIGNWVLNTFLSIAFSHYLAGVRGRTIRDSQSGLWVFRRSLLESLQLTQDGMALSEEIKLEAILRGFRFEEVPIPYVERWAGPPKLSSYRDGRANLMFLFRKRLDVARERAQGRIPENPHEVRGDRVPR